MHIPCTPTSEAEFVPFAAALDEALLPSEAYDAARWLYVPNRYGEYRYLLGTRGKQPLLCMGINPSTAAPGDLDNTLKSVERIAFANGFDSFLMLNVYPQRATRPDDLEATCNLRLTRENRLAFRYALSLCKERPWVWAAWGNLIEKRPYLREVLCDLIEEGETAGAAWFTAGRRSIAGHPHHPLYLKKDSILEPFDIRSYTAAGGPLRRR